MNKEIRDIRTVFSIISLIVIAVAYQFYPSALGNIFFVTGGILLCLLTFAPLALRPVFKGWMTFAHALGMINTQIILFIVYIFVIIPAGVCVRIFGKDPMKRKIHDDASYWEDVEFEGLGDKSRYEKQF